jgi:hypothetical protein
MDNGNIGVLSISAALAFRTTTAGRKTNSWVSDQDIAKVSICAFFCFDSVLFSEQHTCSSHTRIIPHGVLKFLIAF